MKKILSVMFALFSATAMYAQSHGNHLMLGVGGSYPQGVETTLSYEHETDYHNAWEYFGTMYLKYKKDEEVGHITSDSFWRLPYVDSGLCLQAMREQRQEPSWKRKSRCQLW